MYRTAVISGLNHVMVVFFLLYTSSMHKPILTEQSKFNMHWNQIFHLRLSRYDNRPYDYSITCSPDHLKWVNDNSLHNFHSLNPFHSQYSHHKVFSLPASP